MDYQTFPPHTDLASLVKCFWTLEVPTQKEFQKQIILPDGCIDMIFTLGEDVRRYTSETDFLIQPREMILGQITQPFYIQPTGYVNTFAVRFYPYGFIHFVSTSINQLANKETPLDAIFGHEIAKTLKTDIHNQGDTKQRIAIVENFLLARLKDKTTIDQIVKSTIDTLLSTHGSSKISSIFTNDSSRRRQLERKFAIQIGISPKQLGKVIRLQTALKLLLNQKTDSLTQIAYESEYYDQAHFIKDFKEFTGTTPGEFLGDDTMTLSSVLYKQD